MEEIYTLPDGSTVDISSYSQFQKTNFLIKNPGAKKSKGTAKSATALPTKKAQDQSFKKAVDSHLQNTGSKQASGSSGSKKFRLPTDAEISQARKKGLMPPPSSIPLSAGYDAKDNFEYDLKGNLSKKKDKPLPEYKYGKGYKPKHEETREVYLANKENTAFKINEPLTKVTKSQELGYPENDIAQDVLKRGYDAEFKIKHLEKEKSRTDADLDHPYLYYSSFNQEKPDSFVKGNFNEAELEDIGVNTQDFDGFLNKYNYKTDFLEKEQRGYFTEGTGVAGYDEKLAKELQKKKLLTLYMSNMQSRDITKQVLNQDIEISKGLRDKRDIKENIIYDDNKLIKYVEKNLPIYTQKLKESEAKSRKIYEEAKTGGTDFWSWDTASKIGTATWNGFTERIHQLSATAYEKIGLKDQAEYSRFIAEQDAVETPDDRSVGYVGGKETYVDGKKYLVSAKGDVYDADLKIRVTDLLEPKSREKIYESSKYGNNSYIFSPQGVAIGTAAVMGDMIIQAAVTRGVGAFAGIATESRIALNVAGKQTQIGSLFNNTSSALKMIPIKRSTGYAMVSQGALGYSQGFEETLKAARENGINDKEAFALASNAAQRMGVLYATTGVINPQTNVVDNLFTAKNVVKKAIEQYTKTGKKGFIQSIDDVVRNTPRNLVEFAEEGGKEVIQENVQQVGEIGLNRITNQEAGKKLLNDQMTANDFINTSILSFISSGLISKAKLPNFQAEDNDVNDLASLSKLAQNKNQFIQTIDGLVDSKVFTTDEANNLKADVDTYSNNINKLPKGITPSAAMPVMRELDKVTKLENQKKSVDKAFHEEIDSKIEGVRNNIRDIVYSDQIKAKNQTIFTAIKKGIVKDLDLKTFETTAEVKTYLMEELGFDEKSAEFQSNQGGAIIPYEVLAGFSNNPESIKPGQKIIVVNEQKGRESGASEIVQHEFLHGLIHETVKDDPEIQKLLGVALSKELMKLKDIVEAKGTKDNPVPEEFIKRFGKYVEFYDKLQVKERVRYQTFEISKQEYEDKVNQLLGNQWEEVLTLYSDAISNGTVKYDEGTFTKLKDMLRQVLQRLGIKDIKFESGKDVYNFIKDYNKSVETGNFGLAMKKLGNSGAEVNKEKLRQETGIKPFESKLIRRQDDVSTGGVKFSLGERKSSEDIKKDVNKNYDKDKWGAGSALGRDENPAIERVLYDILSEYDYIIKGKAKVLNFANTPGYNDLDMISETYIQLMPHIRNFNKEFLQKREEFKKELISKGLEPNSAEFKQKLEEQDKKGYEGKKGIVKENDDLNAWINSQLVNKMNAAMKSGNVSEEAFTDDIEGEMFKESRIVDGFTGDQSYLEDEGDSVFDSEEDFAQEQNQLAVLLSDPIYRFVDEKGKPIDIETVPFGSFFVTDISDPTIAANIKLRTETDPTKIAELNKELKDLQRGLELQNKQDITFEEKEELKQLRSFKSYDLSTGLMVNTFKALSIQDTPAKIITDEVGREILRSPNIQTLEYRNFKEKLSTLSKTMARRMTFKNGPEIESLIYNEWKLLYDVINHPVDAVTGQSSYASKKLPPRLKETDDKGNFTKIKNITRVRFLQSYYGIDEATRIIKTYGGANVDKELSEFEDPELSEKDGKSLRPTTYFDRRTSLMELFGDVLVLQEARRLIRNPEFLDRVSQRNVNLYNELKDDVIRASVLNDMSKGKSDLVKFSLAESKEDKVYKGKFKKLLNSKEYKDFISRLDGQYLYHSGSDSIEDIKDYKVKMVWFMVGEPDDSFGDGVIYRTKNTDIPGAIIIPDTNRSDSAWGSYVVSKYPGFTKEVLLKYLDMDPNALEDEYSVYNQLKESMEENDYTPNIEDILESKYGDDILTDWVRLVNEDEDKYSTSEGYGLNVDGKVGRLTEVIAFGKMTSKNNVERQDESGNYSKIKFSLAKEKPVRIKPGYITTSPINTLGNDPFYSLKYVELFSSPSELVKFSLDDIEQEAEEPESKFKNFMSKINFRELNDDDGWILKTLQQSDLQDDNVNTKKLHTLKSTNELYDEISDRFDNLLGSLSVGNSENQWIIKEYKDGYIDSMLNRSLTIPEEAFNEPYWSKMKIDESFRKEELTKIQNQQRIALMLLSETVNDIDTFEYSMFFKYLLMKDALSNRYYPDGEKGIIKKSIKKSEYRTTIQPIQDYSNLDFIKEIQKDYKYKKNVGIGAIYLAKKMNEVPLDFSKNFIQEVDYRDNLYKFNRGEEQSEINALNKLASYSIKSGYKGSSWCTGVSKSMAAGQLKDGDFYIFANKQTKVPTLAVRYIGDNIAEMAGTRDNQDLWTQDLDQVEFAISNLPSKNKELALNQLNVARKLLKITEQEIKEIEQEEVLEKLTFSKEINIHFEKELYQKARVASLRLRSLILQKAIGAGISPVEYYKEGFNLDEKGISYVTNELDLDIIFQIEEFTENINMRLQYTAEEASDVDFSENVIFPYEYLQLNGLKKAKGLSINGVTSVTIPKLTEAELLYVEFDKLVEEQSAISLPSKTNYNIDLQFSDNDQDEIGEFLVFDKDIDMSDFDLGLYFNELEMEGINLSNVQNAKQISISAVFADYIYLPKKIKTLSTENVYGKSTSSIEVQGVEEIDTLIMEWSNFDGILFEDLKRIGTVEITLRDEYDDDLEDIIRGSEVFRLADNVFFTFEDYQSSNYKTKTLKSKALPSVKFSLAEEENGKLNPLLKGLPFSKQWVVARDIDNAINKGRAAEGIRIPFKVPSRSKFSDEQTAYFIIQKVAEGFNDFEFRVKKNAKGPLTKQVLDALDIKSKEYQDRAERNNNIEKTINDFIEENKGVASAETFSPETAKNIGKNVGKYEMYLPPEDEDFLGLLYTLAGARGKKGDDQLKFLTDTLLKPYSDAMLNLMKARQTMYKDWQDLINKKHKGISKLLKQDSGYGGYLVDQAVRVYLWSAAGYDIPGLDKKDLFHLREIVRTNPKLRSFASDVSLLSKQANGYTEPDSNWGFGSVVGDINGVISKSNRKKYLEQWQNNVDKAFSKDNLSKIEAVYGRKYVKALRNTLDRMKTGSNRAEGSSDGFINWLNGATAVTMFTNIRSAFLQTLGAVNYLNTSDNNIVKAGAAFLNVPQFLKDFKTIWNSDYSKDRRSGLTNDIAEAELAQIMNDPRNKSILDKFKAANYWILKKGYGPTRFADSFAIAFGGASFYRNRLNAYMKQGKTEAEAEKETMRDFYEVSESSQQSADVSKISMNQASTKGRILLSFLNTPFQYSRIIKRSVIDLAKGRGDVANNIAKIVYYSAIQNIMFNFLQNALFSIIWDDDDERDEAGKGKFDKAKIRAVSGSLDTLLRGSGLQGVIISTVKNIIIKWYEKSGDPEGYGDVLLEAGNIAPSIGIKLRALAKSYKAIEYNKDEIEYKGFSLDNTYAIEALTSLTSASFNIPVDRLFQKIENVSNALNEEYEMWQRVAFAMGYNKWNLGISDEKMVSTNAQGELKIPELKQDELKEPELK